MQLNASQYLNFLSFVFCLHLFFLNNVDAFISVIEITFTSPRPVDIKKEKYYFWSRKNPSRTKTRDKHSRNSGKSCGVSKLALISCLLLHFPVDCLGEILSNTRSRSLGRHR